MSNEFDDEYYSSSLMMECEYCGQERHISTQSCINPECVDYRHRKGRKRSYKTIIVKEPLVSDYPEDCERLKKILKQHGYRATIEQSARLWGLYSESVCASFLIMEDLSDEDVWDRVKEFIVNL